MDADPRSEAERLFRAAATMPAGERIAYLRRAGAGRPGLAALLEEWIALDPVATEGLGAAAVVAAPPAPAEAARPPAVLQGERSWRLLEPLGQGGMGAVFRAERADGEFRQQAAVKLLAGFAARDPEMADRFRLERQILARLEHPYIARLIDGGTTADGTPYLVLEYVDGEPIDRWCARREAGLGERLALFLKTCEAVEAAHRQLVVHRDLKPGNVLVTADGTPKLLDFGIAKLLDLSLAPGPAPRTRADRQLLTPAFAAPEQFLGDPVSTSTDVYALGVLLYLLLAEVGPYHGTEGGTIGLMRAVCEVDPPPPSRAAARAAGETARGRAGRLAGDLDAIVAQAMRKRPAERFGSVAELAADVRRHLAGEPVLARRGGAAYRVRRFVGRHRWGVAFASTLAAMAVVAWIARERQLRIAERERNRAERALSFLVEAFQVAEPDQSRGTTITAREVLDRGAARLDRELAGDPELFARLGRTIGEVYVNLGLLAEAERVLDATLRIERAAGGSPAGLADALDSFARLRGFQGRLEEAEAAAREALAVRERPLDGRPGNALRARLGTRQILGNILAERGGAGASEGEEQLEAARRGWEALIGASAARGSGSESGSEPVGAGTVNGSAGRAGGSAEDAVKYGSVLNDLAVLRYEADDLEGAAALLERALALLRASAGEDHSRTLEAASNLGAVWRAAGRGADAERLWRDLLAARERVLGREHPENRALFANLAGLLAENGEHAEAETLVRQALAAQDRLPDGASHPERAYLLGSLAQALLGQRRLGEAEEAARRALAAAIENNGAEDRAVGVARHDLARVLLERGELDAAERAMDEAAAVFTLHFAPDHVFWSYAWILRGRLALERGRAAEASAFFERAVANRTAAWGEAHWLVADARAWLGTARGAEGRLEEGLSLLESATADLATQRGPASEPAREARARLEALRASAKRPGRGPESIDSDG